MPTKRLYRFGGERKDDEVSFSVITTETEEEQERLLVPNGDSDPLRKNDQELSSRQQPKQNPAGHHDPVVGVSFSMQLVAKIALILLVASQSFLFHCCRISVTNRNEILARQQTRQKYNDTTYRQKSIVPLLRRYSLNLESAVIWSSSTDSASEVATIYPGDDIVVEELMTSTSRFEEQAHLRVLRPYLGFIDQRRRKKPLQRNGTKVYPWIFEPLPQEDQPKAAEFSTNSMCPLLYSAWSTSSTSKYMYANPSLVISQQFWNALQVVVLLLIVVVNFKFTMEAKPSTGTELSKQSSYAKSSSSPNRFYRTLSLILLPLALVFTRPNGFGFLIVGSLTALALCLWTKTDLDVRRDDGSAIEESEAKVSFVGVRPRLIHAWAIFSQTITAPSSRMWSVRCCSLATLCLLPFSSYVSSPGGHLFAFITGAWIAVAVVSPRLNLRLSLGETQAIVAELSGSRFSAPMTICFEETLGFFCTLGSSVYNFAGHTYVWPHWKRQFKEIDRYMGWQSSGDVTWEENWTMWGLFDESGILPPFVPRGNGGSTTGALMFWLDWSVLPFLYCCYYACMIILSQKTPSCFSRWFQRFACTFGILHFLFGTDVVHYRYGRGYRNPHSELFHWTEKWSWRVAILVPIWQNCVTGHWKYGHRFKIMGHLVHYGMMLWSVGFLIFQVLQADAVNTYQFAYGLKKKGVIQYLGWGKHSQLWFELEYPYMRALVQMWIFYALMHVTGFSLFRIVLQEEESSSVQYELAVGATLDSREPDEESRQALEKDASQVEKV